MFTVTTLLKTNRHTSKLGIHCGIAQRSYSSVDDKKQTSEQRINESENPENGKSTNESFIEIRCLYPKQKIEVPPTRKSFFSILKDDLLQAKKYFQDPSNNTFTRAVFPGNVNTLIIGAGPIGTSIAFFLQKFGGPNADVLVIDKDLSPNLFQTNEKVINILPQLNMGLLTQQFHIKENIQLAQFAAEFFRNIQSQLSHLYEVEPIDFKPFGHLTLASKKGIEVMKENHILQTQLGVHNELMTAFQLSQRFPWLNTTDIALGCHGLLNEGWFDPWQYLLCVRAAAMRIGAWFTEAEALEFLYSDDMLVDMEGFDMGEYKPCNEVIVKESNGNIRKIKFSSCIVALGEETGDFTKNYLHIHKQNDCMLKFEFPLEKKKRHVYCFEAPDGGPGLSSPLIHDSTGLQLRREGLGNTYICSCPPIPSEDLKADSLEHDTDYFYTRVWPLLANRFPLFEQLNLKSVHTYFEDCNTFDESPIIGFHPGYHNFIFAAGFGNKAYQYAPGVGRAIAELLVTGHFDTIDLTKFNFNRIIQEVPLFEKYIL